MTTDYEQKIKDQEILITGLKYEIQQLKHRLEHFESYQREKCCDCQKEAIIDCIDAQSELDRMKEKIKEIVK